jgi:hypothetical protein
LGQNIAGWRQSRYEWRHDAHDGQALRGVEGCKCAETEAREAAEEAASVHNRLDVLDHGVAGVNAAIDLLRTEVKGEIAALRTEVKGEIRRLEWMVAGMLAIALAAAGRLFLHG